MNQDPFIPLLANVTIIMYKNLFMFILLFDNQYLVIDTGLDVLANAKRGGSKIDGAFKVPREKGASVVASMDEEDKSLSSGLDEEISTVSSGARNGSGRRYRGTAASEASHLGTFS